MPQTLHCLPLTAAEMGVLSDLNAGMSLKDSAKSRWLSQQTIKYHRTHIYRKLGVGSGYAALCEARRLGIIPEPLMPDAVVPDSVMINGVRFVPE